MKKPAQFLLFISVFALGGMLFANTPPTVTNVSASQRNDGSKIVDIWYGVNDVDNDTLTVSLAVSDDNGATFGITPSPTNLSGAVGENILSGTNKHIIWNAGNEGIAFNGSQFRVKVTATENINLNYGLVAYYPFNGNANDESGYGNNGIRYGVTNTTDRFGTLNSAFYFDGDDYIQIANSQSLQFSYITLCAWFSFIAGGIDNPMLISKRSDNPSLGFDLATITPNSIRELHYDQVINGNWGTIPSNSSVSQNEWHFATATFDGLSQRIYIDGQLKNEIERPGSLTNSVSDLTIGKISRSFDDLYQGSIDDIRIYNRALNFIEIQALYHEGGWTGIP